MRFIGTDETGAYADGSAEADATTEPVDAGQPGGGPPRSGHTTIDVEKTSSACTQPHTFSCTGDDP